jgi:hypothetical protein
MGEGLATRKDGEFMYITDWLKIADRLRFMLWHAMVVLWRSGLLYLITMVLVAQ